MGLFTRNKEAKPPHGLRRLLPVFKRRLSKYPSLVLDDYPSSTNEGPPSIQDDCPPSNYEDTPINPSLWGRAYDTLRSNEPDLTMKYDQLIFKEAQKTSDQFPDSAPNDQPSKDVDNTPDQQPQQAQLDNIIARGLKRLEDRETKHGSPSRRVSEAARLILWAKDWISEAVKLSPQASIVWAGVCIVLPLFTNPVTADEDNRDGFAYVTTRIRYYTELEPLVQGLGRNPKVTPALLTEIEKSIVDLYRHILEFQIRSVLRFYENSFKRYVKSMPLIVNWHQKRLDIEKLEGIVNGNLEQVTQLVSREELESINNTSGEALETMLKFLSVSENQLHVTKEHRDIAKKHLEIQEDEVKRKLSDKQKECLQLFRLTDPSRDATYEWYKDRVQDRVHGTCEWFLKHENFQKWLNQDSGPLLVSADPGCGKSVLAKYLIDHGLPRSSTICYYFFKDQDQNTVRQALCALLHQIFLAKPSLISHAISEFENNGRGLIDSKSSLWAVLNNTIRDPQAGPIILVLDALDECAESEFQDLMRNLENQFSKNQSSSGKFKYILTSRPGGRIRYY
ncbi:hypothetical protein ONZ43_g7305 [Nemania bipapillata]|uniref:Uncharacterized protein n=1 Tax=Nemania bipapillata TaxID=110536 RepID=A0ACC2HSI5_9PEZI|nr:hypothetical protein ONZ43_g7305 [Nemania bipapillata]